MEEGRDLRAAIDKAANRFAATSVSEENERLFAVCFIYSNKCATNCIFFTATAEIKIHYCLTVAQIYYNFPLEK